MGVRLSKQAICRFNSRTFGNRGSTVIPLYLVPVKGESSMFDAFKRIVARDGFRALFHGLPASWLQAGPGIAVQFLVYEQMKAFANT